MKVISFLLATTALLTFAGCAHVQPWERGKLAHKTMTMQATGVAEEHVYAVQEGAVGGGAGGEGGGCGCN